MKFDLPTDGVKPYALLILLCIVLYAPGLATLPPIDRDEARFSQATRQMIQDRDFVRIRFQDEPRNKKPIGIYWLQAACVELLGDPDSNRIWPYRLPSLFGAALAALFVFAFGKRLFEPRQALLGAALTAASLILIIEAHQATTDAALLCCVAASQGALGISYTRARSNAAPQGLWPALIFWTAQGFGILLKGPVICMIAALTVIALLIADREARWFRSLRPLPGIILTSLIVCPWAVAITKATGGTFFQDAVRNDLLPKLVSGQESHGFMPGYYLLLAPLTFWPASAYVAPALVAAWRSRASASVRFCLAWIVPNWIVFELVPTKLPHYVMPLYPALALLTAGWIISFRDNLPRNESRWPIWVASTIWAIAGIGIAAGIVALPWFMDGRFVPATILISCAALTAMVFALRETIRLHAAESILIAIAGSALVLAPTFHLILPRVDSIWLSRTIVETAELATAKNPSGDALPPLAAAGYHEPSLVFMAGRNTQLTTPAEAAAFIREHPLSLAVVDERGDAVFRKRAERLAMPLHLVKTIRGFQYSKGNWTSLRLYANGSAPAPPAGEKP